MEVALKSTNRVALWRLVFGIKLEKKGPVIVLMTHIFVLCTKMHHATHLTLLLLDFRVFASTATTPSEEKKK